MRIYISTPVSKADPQGSRERAESARAMVERRGHKAVTPFDACPEPGLKYAQYIGRYVEALLQCDGVFLLSGWSSSSGCNIEWRAAQVFNKKIYHHISEVPDETR